jgi:predicted nucleic acid-binding protein
MKDRGYLLDASALYPLLDYADRVDPKEVHILSLTFYEVGNAIWKEYRFRRVKDPLTLSAYLEKFMRKLDVVEDPPLEEVMRVALERGFTYYDASYVYVAESSGFVLVSNDGDLIERGNAVSLKDFVKSSRL